ncbi:RpiB/LacA/LacB family sugar-phosphate isomerase [Patescibacteria group bacterium]|nr:RpiB/LacA/LacB family sugar-phosphate isomerase [Patescibacteria group bacterium]
MIYIGSDHGGFKLKEELKNFLRARKIAFRDMGAKKYVEDDDYPQYAIAVAREVKKSPEKNKGILLCRSGQGVCIAANKFKGVRAALAWNERIARHSRNDDDANVLCLASDFISPETAQDVLSAWLDTPFSFEQRHIRRIKEIKKLE